MKFKTPSRAASTLTIVMVLLVATTIFAQQLSNTRSNDETTAKLVTEMISRYHISRSKLDDNVSSKLLDRYLKDLDPQKLYLTASDVQSLNKYRTELDDLLKAGNVDFAYSTHDLYKQRVRERVALAHQLIDADHDFSIEETMRTDFDDLSWARTEGEIRERWRQRIKYDLLILKIDGTPVDESRERLHRRYKSIQDTTEKTEDFEILEMYLSAMAHCFDPHSSYMSPQTLEDFQIQMRLSLEGIGAALRSEDGYTVVAQIVPGGAAEKDGRLKVGDKIIAVGQAEGDFVDVVEMKLSKVVRYIRGDKGTKVRLQVKTADTSEIKVYELTRQKIELKSSEVKGTIIPADERVEGRSGRIGVINIPSFYRDFGGAQRGDENFKSTARDVVKVLMEFRDQGGVDAIVIDLRTNGGGALSEAIEVSGLFIDDGPVVQVKEQNGEVKTHDDIDTGVVYSGPLVVVCNRLSASASEIFAGVIKDYKRGIVIGDTTTHGKGTVQNVMPVSQRLFQFLTPQDRGALKLTINQFYRVNGDSTQNRGVRSDVVLPSLLDHMDLGESFLENALKFDRIEPAKYQTMGMTTPEIVSTLKQASQRRINENGEFKKIQKDIDSYLSRKERKWVTLNEDALRKEREEDKNVEEQELQDQEEDNGEGPIFPEGAYNDEVLSITLDYVHLLKGLNTVRR